VFEVLLHFFPRRFVVKSLRYVVSFDEANPHTPATLLVNEKGS
jgi:hypothetical protein